MFISNLEKSNIERRLSNLEARVEQLSRSLNALHDAKTLAPNPASLKLQKKKSATDRVKRNAYARKYYQRKKAEKLAAAKAAPVTPATN